MDSTESHGFVLASFLVLMFLGDLTDACSCEKLTLQKACCKAKIVMRAKFMSVKQDPESRSFIPDNIYTIQPIEVYKGPEKAKKEQFLYTPVSDNYCGYIHKGPLQGEEYVFSGWISADRLQISLCSFAAPWDELSNAQKVKLKSVVDKDCSTICGQL